MESSENKSANISSPNCNKMPSFGKQAFTVLFFFFFFYFILLFFFRISYQIL